MDDKEIVLIKSDPMEILNDCIKFHKEETGIDLPQAHESTYIYATVAAALGTIKAEMNQVSLQNYLKWAKNSRLDMKGTMYGSRGERLGANQARTTMRCYVSVGANRDVIIDKGTRFIHKNNVFRAEERYIVPDGQTYIDVPVVCETTGDLGIINIGEVTQIVDYYDYYDKCENITPVTGGQDIEKDEHYRERLRLLPESFTSAGSEGAYKYWTLQSSPLVTDVVVKSPTPNKLDIYVINGLKTISTEEKDSIFKFITQDNIKALDDEISIKDPNIHNFNVDIDYYLYDDAPNSVSEIEEQLTDSIKNYFNNMEIGKSINTQDIIKICKENRNISRVIINSPSDYIASDITLCIGSNVILKFLGSESR